MTDTQELEHGDISFLFQETEEQRIAREYRQILTDQLNRALFVPRRLWCRRFVPRLHPPGEEK